jgi:hypothetical protein
VSESRAHDPGRFARAVALAMRDGGVVRVGPRQFKVLGSGRHEKEYWIDLDEHPPCTCGDQEHRGGSIRENCYHVLACRLAIKDPSLQHDLMEHAYRAQLRTQELERSTRRRKAS